MAASSGRDVLEHVTGAIRAQSRRERRALAIERSRCQDWKLREVEATAGIEPA
jgi:hypothetical protein